MDYIAQNPLGVNSGPVEAAPVRYCLYARKSSESDEKQAMSIESQIKEMLQMAQRDNLEVVEIRRESHSAKDTGQRPVFNSILADVRLGTFTGILAWAPDRLSRNAGDLGALVDMLDQKVLIEIRTYGQRFSNNPNEKFLLMILGAQGKLENDQKSLNVKRGLRAKCEMGLWPSHAPTGYLTEKRIDRKGYVMVDTQRAPVIRQMFEKMAYEHWSGRRIYAWLKFELDFRTARSNKHLTLSNIYRLLQTPFFYGRFEYPYKSGNWYTGIHEPIITRELYEKAQEQLKRDNIQRGPSKEFAFTRMMTCGLCGSGVSAEEKFKNLKSGEVARYVYYGCTRSKDRFCKGGYIREEDLISQIQRFIEDASIDDDYLSEKLKNEILRQQKLFALLDMQIEKITFETTKRHTINYLRYILKEGTLHERRDTLKAIKNKVLLEKKRIILLPES